MRVSNLFGERLATISDGFRQPFIIGVSVTVKGDIEMGSSSGNMIAGKMNRNELCVLGNVARRHCVRFIQLFLFAAWFFSISVASKSITAQSDRIDLISEEVFRANFLKSLERFSIA